MSTKAPKYNALQEYLTKQKSSQVSLSFDFIIRELKIKLPNSAYKHKAWWANDRSHSQAKSWLDAGFLVTHYPQNEYVVFERSK